VLQWREQAVEPEGDRRSELWFTYHLGRLVREKLATSTDARDRPVLDLTWDYPTSGATAEPSADAVLREINGVDLGTGDLLDSFTDMRADGTTSGGCWIYTGVYAGGVNQAARRTPGGGRSPTGGEWGWAWPLNRRILYNRASADPEGRPWSERKAHVWWDEAAGSGPVTTSPTSSARSRPGYRPPDGALAEDAIAGDDPFIMQADGKGWLYAPSGVLDGPLPDALRAGRGPVANPLYGQQTNPLRQVLPARRNPRSPRAAPPAARCSRTCSRRAG
jgi:formate dehydrogenase major subunit